MILYHGTNKMFTRFEPGQFFTDSFDVAGAYACYKESSSYDKGKPRVVMVRVSPGNVRKVHGSELARAMCTELLPDGSFADIEWREADRFLRAYQRMRDIDTLVLQGVKDLAPEGACRVYDQYIIRCPDQIQIVNEVAGVTMLGHCGTVFQPDTEEVYQ